MAKKTKKVKTKKKYKAILELVSNSGFYSVRENGNNGLNNSSANIYYSSLIIHGNNRYMDPTGWTTSFFILENQFWPNDPPKSNLFISLDLLKDENPTKLVLDLWANIATEGSGVAKFYVEVRLNDAQSPATMYPKPFEFSHTNRYLEIPIYKNANNGIYYFKIWAVYTNSNLGFELNRILLV